MSSDSIDSIFYGNRFKYYNNFFRYMIHFESIFMIFTFICGMYNTLNSEFYMIIFLIYNIFKLTCIHNMKSHSYFYQILLLENRDMYID